MNTKGTEEANEQTAVETKVETVDHRHAAGEDKEPTMENVHVVHLKRDTSKPGVVAGAAQAITKAFQSAKDAIYGTKGQGGSDK